MSDLVSDSNRESSGLFEIHAISNSEELENGPHFLAIQQMMPLAETNYDPPLPGSLIATPLLRQSLDDCDSKQHYGELTYRSTHP